MSTGPAQMEPDRGLRRTTWLVGAVVLVASAVPFLPLLDAGFVNWDDDKNFVRNEAWRGLSWEHLQWMFTTFHYGGYHPLSWLSVAVDHALWGMNPRGYHLTNLLLHALNAVLVLRLCTAVLRAAGRTITHAAVWAAGGAAVLFAVHPLRVESVAWITERRGLLAGLFLLLSALAYLRAHRRDAAPRTTAWFLALSVGAYLLSLLSKGLAMVLPALLLVLDAWPLLRFRAGGRGIGRLLLEKVPYVAIAAVVGLLARAAQETGGAVYSWTEYPLPARIAQAGYSVWFYLVRTVFPTDLCVLHPLQEEPSWLEPRFLLAGIATVAVTAFLLIRWRRWPWLLVAWVSYGMLLAPVSGLAQAGPSLVAERYSYLPMVPLTVLGAAGLLAAWERRPDRPRAAVIAGAVAVIAVAWGFLSRAQSFVWEDSVHLWSRAVEVHPESVHAHLNLGAALSAEGRHADAAAQYETATHLAPDLGSAWYGLGLALLRREEPARARAALAQAERLFDTGRWVERPARAELLYVLALASHLEGSSADAATWCRRAIAADRGYVHTYPLLAELLVQRGEREEAIEVLEQGLEAVPGDDVLRRRLEELRR